MLDVSKETPAGVRELGGRSSCSRDFGTNAWLDRSLALPKTADSNVSNSRTRSDNSQWVADTRHMFPADVMGYLTARAVSTMFMELSVQRKELTDDE